MGEEVKYNGVNIETILVHTKDFGESGKFTIRLPNPFQKTKIIAATTRALEGFGKEAVGEDQYEYVRMLVTLNSIIQEPFPSGWTSADACPDEELLYSIWGWCLDCEKKFATELKRVAKGKKLGET